jgi:hypothetical protein
MNKKRIFTFGCSLTRYSWPTWANIMFYDIKIPLYNCAVSGIGNVGIFHRLVECDLKYKFTEDDLILILWSSWNREDRYINGIWQAHGNVFNNDFYDENFIKKYWSIENNIIKNATAIISANKIYKIDFQGHIAPFKMKDTNYVLSNEERKLLEFYGPYIEQTNLFYKKPPMGSIFANTIMNDGHPDIIEHLYFLKNCVYENLGLALKDETTNLVNEMHESLLKIDKTLDTESKVLMIRKIINEEFNLSF